MASVLVAIHECFQSFLFPGSLVPLNPPPPNTLLEAWLYGLFSRKGIEGDFRSCVKTWGRTKLKGHSHVTGPFNPPTFLHDRLVNTAIQLEKNQTIPTCWLLSKSVEAGGTDN